MIEPMVVIVQSIAASIEVMDDQIKVLEKQILTRKEMEQNPSIEWRNTELQETAIRAEKIAIAEYEIERRMVQDAGIQFGFLLKTQAITSYNDATLEYLGYLVDHEKMMVQSRGTKQGRDDLEQYKWEYIQNLIPCRKQ
jgi:hypothetical protein